MFPAILPAQNHPTPQTQTATPQSKPAPTPCVEDMPGMKMCPDPPSPNQQPNPTKTPDKTPDPGMAELMQQMHPQTFLQAIQHHAASGTSAEPNSTPTPMLMTMPASGPLKSGPLKSWMLMFHSNVFLSDIQQTSPRGADKLFSTNWFMPMAERPLGPGELTLRAMLSLEPATITGERYPLLFQQGETAYGKPIADGQHPHNLFMEVAALYDLHLGESTLLSLYAAPQGDPAIGPTAYPHRASASENPVASLGHHQEDSTHISDDVVTLGLTHRIARLEIGGFHGREPGENRWNFHQGALDSWATRLTLQPGQNWSGQYSYARIVSPESLFPTENQERMTASVMYNKPLGRGNWANTALWGRTRSLGDSAKENSYLFESTLGFQTHNYIWTRLENAGRSNELLIGEHTLPPGFQERPLTHVQAYTFGYDRDINLIPHISSAIGAELSLYTVGQPLQPTYGSNPIGLNIFLRLRPTANNKP